MLFVSAMLDSGESLLILSSLFRIFDAFLFRNALPWLLLDCFYGRLKKINDVLRRFFSLLEQRYFQSGFSNKFVKIHITQLGVVQSILRYVETDALLLKLPKMWVPAIIF